MAPHHSINPEPIENSFQSDRKKPEIVAPAGDYESFTAAVSHGADAIYLGVKEFNARRRAKNFTIEELPHIVREAHLNDVKVYLTLNILLKNFELLDALKIAEKAVDANVDAIIVQDLGFADLLLRSFKGIRLHASTQMNTHNINQVRLLKKIGFKRVVFSRELSLADIRHILSEEPVESEVFIHGALCYSFSGQCLMSSIVGGRSGNRGLCAQPCRLPYRLEINEGEANTKNRREINLPYSYLLSTKDLIGINLLPKIIDAGITALKIEGRLKSAEYVALVTQVYSRELQRAYELKENYRPLEDSILILEEAFSRGFSNAYLTGLRGNQIMSYSRPNNRGAYIGRVTYIDNLQGRIGVTTKREISVGDVIEVWTSKKGRVVQKIEKLEDESGITSTVKAENRAHIYVDKDRHLIRPGDRVYRVVNAQLLNNIRKSITQERRGEIELDIDVKIDITGKAEVKASFDSQEIAFDTEVNVEQAIATPTTREVVINQLEKFGGTPYKAGSITVSIPENVHIRIKEINRIRREIVERLNKLRLQKYVSTVEKQTDYKSLAERLKKTAGRQAVTAALHVKVADRKLFEIAAEEKPDIIFVRYPFFRNSGFASRNDFKNVFEKALSKGIEVGIALPEFLKDSEAENVEEFLTHFRPGLKWLLVENPGLAEYFSTKGYQVILDYHANIFNSLTADYFRRTDIRMVTLSTELNADEIINLARHSTMPLSLLIAGDIEVMSAEHCPLTALSGAEEFQNSTRERERLCAVLAKEGFTYPAFCEYGYYSLKDQAGYSFPLRTDTLCRGYIYNSRFLCYLEGMEKFLRAGITAFRVDLLSRGLFSFEEARKILSFMRLAVDELKKGKRLSVKEGATDEHCPSLFTRGHFERGVM